jgi:hypothetical protein
MMYRAHIMTASASVLLIVLALAQPDTAAAQADTELEECAAINGASQRLACYDNLLRVPETAIADDDEPTDSAEVSLRAATPAAEPESRSERQSRRRRNPERTAQNVVVVAVRTNISNLSVFTTEDGRVYAQTSADSIRYAEPPFGARLEPASFGSFFLIPDGSSRRVRVSLRE